MSCKGIPEAKITDRKKEKNWRNAYLKQLMGSPWRRWRLRVLWWLDWFPSSSLLHILSPPSLKPISKITKNLQTFNICYPINHSNKKKSFSQLKPLQSHDSVMTNLSFSETKTILYFQFPFFRVSQQPNRVLDGRERENLRRRRFR